MRTEAQRDLKIWRQPEGRRCCQKIVQAGDLALERMVEERKARGNSDGV